MMQPVPISILHEITRLPGNDSCCDCDSLDITWGSISHGILICLDCAGKHRSLGVRTSFVNSIYMDHWSKENLEMLRQGGNQKMKEYFRQMNIPETSIVKELYETEAAQHYRERLKERVRHILSQAPSTLTKVPNGFREYQRKHSNLSVDSSEPRVAAAEEDDKPSELRSVVFTEEKLGMRLSKRPNNTAIVSQLTAGGFAERNGVRVGDSVWGVADQVNDAYDEILRRIAIAGRPLSIFFYRDAEEVASSAVVSECTSLDGGSDSDDEDEALVVRDLSQLLLDQDTSSRTNQSSIDNSSAVAFDYRVTFFQGPLGVTVSKDSQDRSEITKVDPNGQALHHGVKVRDLVVGAEDQWFTGYDDAMAALPVLQFPATLVFRRIRRRR